MPRYEDIETRAIQIHQAHRAFYLKERSLYSDMAELILAPLEEADSWKPSGEWPDDTKTAVTLAIARMFNDFEASQNAILRGLAEQSYMPIRDAIECMMLTRLFRIRPEKANDWLYKLKLYPAANVKTWLEEAGESPAEYLFFDFFSKHAHANVIGSAYRVRETNSDDASRWTRTIHFGADPNYLISAIAYAFLLAMMYFALKIVLPPLYHSFLSDSEGWRERVAALRPELEGLDLGFWLDTANAQSLDEEKLDQWQEDLVRRKSGQKALEERLRSLLDKGAEDA